MTSIIPHLWFDNEAKDAAELYTSVFDNSKIGNITPYPTDTPSNKPEGSIMTVDFTLADLPFTALNGGPEFTFNPSISFQVKCSTESEVEQLYENLGEDGSVMMPLASYPFSKKFAWISDRFGISWQLLYTDEDFDQKIIPSLMFVGKQSGKARQAIEHYTSIFQNSEITALVEYGENEPSEVVGTIKQGAFTLENLQFRAMDSALDHKFSFNEAISLVIPCKNQEEIDYYWDKLSSDPSKGQCGWLSDQFGVSWQVVPDNLDDYLLHDDPDVAKRAMEAILQMKKLIIKDIEKTSSPQ